MNQNVVRAFFGAASGLFLVALLQDFYFVMHFDLTSNLTWINYLGYLVSAVQIGLLLIPVFFVDKKLIALLSICGVFFLEILYTICFLIRDLSYLDDLMPSELIRFYILPMLMIPNNAFSLDLDFIRFNSMTYVRALGMIIAIVAAVLSFKRTTQNQRVNSEKSSVPGSDRIFIPGGKPAKPTLMGLSNEGLDQIEKLGDLLNKGLITQEEFEIKKRQILGL